MLDVKLIQDGDTGEFDLAIDTLGDLETVNDLSTALLVSMLTDARADPSQVVVPEYRRGWIGDAVPPIDGFKLGSLLWLTETAKTTQGTMTIAASFARDALQWLLDQGIAEDVQVEGEITGPRQGRLRITIVSPGGVTQTQYVDLWRATAFLPTALPLPIVEQAPFTPASLADLIIWGDAVFSDHEIDANCGVSVTFDIANRADYFQANADRRPQLLRGTGGWFYRFDGVDDYMSILSQPLPSLREGTAFFIMKPVAGSVVDGQFYTIGFNGFTDAVNGIVFSLQASDQVRMRADNGDLEVTVTGTGPDTVSFGVVFRWGPALDGAEAETTNLGSASDPSYSNNIGGPNIAVLGAGFDGANVDLTNVGAFEMSAFVLYGRRVSDLEALDLLDYAAARPFTSPTGEPFGGGECDFFTDDTGWVDG